MGYSGHDHARRHPAQHPREPRLVHTIHTIPGRDRPGPAGGAPQLPDHRDRPHRHGDRERVAPRRGDGRRRGDVHAVREGDGGGGGTCLFSSPTTATRRRSRSCARGRNPSASRCGWGRAGISTLRTGRLRRPGAVPGDRWRRARLQVALRRGPRGRQLRRRGGGPDVPAAPHATGRVRCGCGGGERPALRSARWGTAARTRRT